MARFDVHRNPDGPGYLLDCQADMLSHLNTRLMVPLLPREAIAFGASRLNPSFTVEGQPHAMMTHYATAIPAKILGPALLSPASEHYTITNAWDMLLTGV